jgi:hypothetical protein
MARLGKVVYEDSGEQLMACLWLSSGTRAARSERQRFRRRQCRLRFSGLLGGVRD